MTRATPTSAEDRFIVQNVLVPGGGLWQSNEGVASFNGRAVRDPTINTGVKNLVLIMAGQSNRGGVAESAYTPTNASAIDNFNIYDGQLYAAADPPMGATWVYTSLGESLPLPSPGFVGLRVADQLIDDGKFARVILVPIAVGASTVQQWATGGVLSGRIRQTMERLATKGIVPGITNLTFAIEWGQGESNHGTSQAAYEDALNEVIAEAYATDFDGRFFVAIETWAGGVTDADVQAAQAAVVDGINIFQSANADSLNNTYRYADGTHFDDTGNPALSALICAAFYASGSPF